MQKNEAEKEFEKLFNTEIDGIETSNSLVSDAINNSKGKTHPISVEMIKRICLSYTENGINGFSIFVNDETWVEFKRVIFCEGVCEYGFKINNRKRANDFCKFNYLGHTIRIVDSNYFT